MIKCKNLTKIFNQDRKNEQTALKSINLEVKSGELVVLRGASGSGKSTLLSLIAALSKPTFGEVVVDEKRVSKMPDNFTAMFRRQSIGFIFQKYNLVPSLNAYENIIIPTIPSNPDEKELEQKVDRLLEMFNISSKKESLIKNLSGGEQQRVAIARALINDPKIIIADEPTANLDEKLSLEFIEILQRLKEQSRTIIVATHDPLFFDLDFCDRVVSMRDGEILCS